MKTLLCILFSAATVLPLAEARANTAYGEIEVTRKGVTHKDGLCRVELEIAVGGVDISPDRSFRLTPYLVRGDQSREMPSVFISGKRRYKAFLRSDVLGKSQESRWIYSAEDFKDSDFLAILYTEAIPYEPWMDRADVIVVEDYCDCGMKTLMTDQVVLSAPQPVALPQLAVNYITPEVEPQKVRAETFEAFLNYPAGKSAILPDFRDNHVELGQIYLAIEKIVNNGDLMVKSIHIQGYASPEGTFQTNQALSEKRAGALKEFIVKRYDLPSTIITAEGMSEDWDLLRKLVEVSDMPDKRQVLGIIDSVTIFDGRESRIMALGDGGTYRYMMQHFFPPLRRSRFTLKYYVTPFSIEQSKEVLRTDPGLLSLNEIYQVATSYPKGSDGFQSAFETAVKLFPQDAVANINAGATALERHDLPEAEKYLLPFAHDPRAWNNLGVLYMLRKEPAKAAGYIRKAPAGPETDRNLKAIETMEASQWQIE